MSWPKCPKCGSKTSCIDSRPVLDAVRRRYRCIRKDHRWSTLEKIAESRSRYDEELSLNGKTKSLRAWAKLAKLSPEGLMNRLKIQGLSLADAIRHKGRSPFRLRIKS